MKKLKYSEIDSIIKKSIDTMSDSIRTVDEYTGWHQHLGSNKIGIVATSMAIKFYKELVGTLCPSEDAAKYFIYNKQNEDGGWPYISNTNGESNIEATCWALQALSLYDKEYQECIEKGILWLIKKNTKKEIDTGWGFIDDSISRTYNTCFVLRTLKSIKNNHINCQKEIESALKWLRDTQDNNGAWGEMQGGRSSVFFTAFVILTLIEYDREIDKPRIKKALDWLETRIKDIGLYDNSLECYLELMEGRVNNSLVRIPFFHYVLPHIICAFIKGGRHNNSIVFNGMILLKERFIDGYWNHPFVENSNLKPIWALYDSIQAFCILQQRYAPIWVSKANNKGCHLYKKNDIKYFIVPFKKMVAVTTFNPVRLISWINKKIITFGGLTLVIAISLNLILYLYQFIPYSIKQEIDDSKDFFISIIASIIASIIIYIFQKVWKFLNPQNI
ncbi:terpene cyclase/mutase family protein [Bacteroides fragilis]|uniref:prenyltransferase/squalene oxidase repeat-containing protein n=1 Tax=Bacteroides fragilis TaxID=817 RepID=UPI00202F472C|nr:prenyltransferase/squalene oxidase repeat-containing protein [Bacteroides fragilis]MCM0301929.1 terpene cyclase/mutase family protein [Bacteroides fragilis]